MWTALPLEKSRSPATVNKLSKPRHNSRTKLCIELSLIHNRDNVELYLHCKFQSSPFSVRRKNGVTGRQNDRQRDYSMPRGSAHRGIMTKVMTHFTRFETIRHGYVTCTSPLRGLISSTCARVLNHYKALFVATVGQQVPVAQRFSAVVCDVVVHGSILTMSIDFCFFFPQKLKFSS